VAGRQEIVINGTPGNALGSYLDGCNIIVMEILRMEPEIQ
jgi:hypothetical protein